MSTTLDDILVKLLQHIGLKWLILCVHCTIQAAPISVLLGQIQFWATSISAQIQLLSSFHRDTVSVTDGVECRGKSSCNIPYSF